MKNAVKTLERLCFRPSTIAFSSMFLSGKSGKVTYWTPQSGGVAGVGGVGMTCTGGIATPWTIDVTGAGALGGFVGAGAGPSNRTTPQIKTQIQASVCPGDKLRYKIGELVAFHHRQMEVWCLTDREEEWDTDETLLHCVCIIEIA